MAITWVEPTIDEQLARLQDILFRNGLFPLSEKEIDEFHKYVESKKEICQHQCFPQEHRFRIIGELIGLDKAYMIAGWHYHIYDDDANDTSTGMNWYGYGTTNLVGGTSVEFDLNRRTWR